MHMSPGSIVWLAEKDETIQTENKDSDCIKKETIYEIHEMIEFAPVKARF